MAEESDDATFCCRRAQQLWNIGCESGEEVAPDEQLPGRCFWHWFDDQCTLHRGIVGLPLRTWRCFTGRVRWYASPRYREQRRREVAEFLRDLDSD
ncbi:MAG TPA: hypothetical protein VMU40_02490 [Steroidobacteraceae bacterium]|nr:hypothetical protein [Steroidobacteraceae bacterium]